MVSLREITAETVRRITSLSVSREQERFVASNAVSLAEALFSTEAWYRAIYSGDEPAGFVMLADESLRPDPPARPQIAIWRFMVDERFQGKGIGAEALRLVVEHASAGGRFDALLLSYVPGDGNPEGFYRKAGFRHTGRVEGGEIVLELPLGDEAGRTRADRLAEREPLDPPTIEPLTRSAADRDLDELARLLADAVASGAAVSFVAPFPAERAREWWSATLAAAPPRAVFLVARDAEGIAGSVQLHPAWAPNQPHRAEIVKLLVHRRCRRRGLGARLMEAAEEAARARGFTLLTLDAKRGAEAERLYRKAGWTPAGTVPHYAVDTDGTTLHDAVLFYKELAPDRS